MNMVFLKGVISYQLIGGEDVRQKKEIISGLNIKQVESHFCFFQST